MEERIRAYREQFDQRAKDSELLHQQHQAEMEELREERQAEISEVREQHQAEVESMRSQRPMRGQRHHPRKQRPVPRAGD